MSDEVCWIENKDGDCFGVLRKNLVEVMAHCDDSGYYELCVDGDPVLSYPSLEEAKAAGNSILDAGPVPEPRVPSSVGNWLWGEMMNYCKVNKIHPGDSNRLFEIVVKARQKFSEPRDMSDEAMKKAFNDHEHYGKQEFLIWEECWKYLRGNK